MPEGVPTTKPAQRLSVEQLDAWKALGYGMFIHYGMSTFSPHAAPRHMEPLPLERYTPTKLDVGQWVRVARDAGMRYGILTVRHGTGFALWPAKGNDYHVGNTAYSTDVVEAFVTACREHGILPALYYIPAHRFVCDSEPPPTAEEKQRRLTEAALGEIEELLGQYGPIGEMWFDGPGMYGAEGRRRIYDLIAGVSPDTVVANNGAFETNGIKTVVKPDTFPTDVVVIETSIPPYYPLEWFDLGPDITGQEGEPKSYYMPTECVTCIERGARRWWFGGEQVWICSDMDLLGMRILARERHANIVFNVPPTPEGLLRQDYIDALGRLRKNWEKLYG